MNTHIAQAPAPPAAPVVVTTSSPKFSEAIEQIALELLIPSPTNPRKTYDQESLAGLAENIKAEGIVQPIVVRSYDWFARNPKSSLNPSPTEATAKFEIVAGHRRVLAAKLAGLKTVPAVVRRLADRQVIEIQITENEQREDVKAIEQGRGYKALVDQLAKEQTKTTRQSLIEQVAARIGKSVRHVYARIKLGDLSPKVQDKVDAGTIEASHADLLVTLQPADQERAVGFLFQHRGKDEGPRSVRELKRFIAEEVQCDLSAAPWKKDDAALVQKSGACSSCEKRTGANPKLHPDVKAGKDLCLDRACYELKRTTFVKVQELELQQQQREKLKNAGATNAKVQAVKVARISPERSEYSSRLSRLELKDVLFTCEYDPTYKFVKDSAACAQPAVIVEGPELGHKRFVCLSTSGCSEHWAKQSGGGATIPKAQLDKRRRELAKQRLDREVEKAVMLKVLGSSPASLGLVELKRIAWAMWDRVVHNTKRELLAVMGLQPKAVKQTYGGTYNDCDKPIEDKLSTAKTVGELFGFLLLLSVFEAQQEYRAKDRSPSSRADVLKALKIDAEKIRKELEAAAAAKEKAKAKPAAQTSAKKANGKCTKCGCTPQHRCVVAHVKGKAQACKLVDGVCTGCSKAKKPAAAKKGGR